ncbi:MAG: hypothetical protein IH599_05775, partial [Bacteroidales bacterium]|nr:hypothetical protein [Bacteroidales bacterium]
PPRPDLQYSSKFFRETLLHTFLQNFLDNSLQPVVFHTETAGDIGVADPLTFSIQGASWMWNKYYLDDIRTDDPWQPGNALYVPSLQRTALSIGLNEPWLSFVPDRLDRSWLSAVYNQGGIGGISGFTQPMVEWFHSTATDRQRVPVPGRRQVEHAMELAFGTPLNGKGHQLSGVLGMGSRTFPDISFEGVQGFYPEENAHLMLHYQRPVKGRSSASFGALISAAHREHYLAEAYYGREETSSLNSVNTTVYLKQNKARSASSAALTYGFRGLRHNEEGFSRNILDQDGEGYEPWYPSSGDHFLGLQGSWERDLCSGLRIQAYAYEHFLFFNPVDERSVHPVYMMNADTWQSLYAGVWKASAFVGGLLENRAGLSWKRNWGGELRTDIGAFVSLDGFLLEDRSFIRPGLEASLRLDWQPFPWFHLGARLGHKKIPFNSGHLRFLSPDYLSGSLVYWDDENNDRIYQDEEAGSTYLYSGGEYHEMGSELRQPGLIYLDLPLEFRTGKYGKVYLHNFYKQYKG